MSPLQVIASVVGIVVVIAGAYYTTWFLASKASRTMGMQRGKGIKVLESVLISRDKTVCVLEALGKVYLVILTPQGATLLDTLDMDDYAQEAPVRWGEAREDGRRPPSPVTVGSGLFAAARGAAAKPHAPPAEAQKPQKAPPQHSPSPAVAQEEDDLDEVYRRIQSRRVRADGESPSQQGRGHG